VYGCAFENYAHLFSVSLKHDFHILSRKQTLHLHYVFQLAQFQIHPTLNFHGVPSWLLNFTIPL